MCVCGKVLPSAHHLTWVCTKIADADDVDDQLATPEGRHQERWLTTTYPRRQVTIPHGTCCWRQSEFEYLAALLRDAKDGNIAIDPSRTATLRLRS